MFICLTIYSLISLQVAVVVYSSTPDGSEGNQLYSIKGKIVIRSELEPEPNWSAKTYVMLDYGKYNGFVEQDGSFKIEDIPTGTYILEVVNSDYTFESIRVDISSRGKIQARRLNLLQPNVVQTMQYPVQMNARERTRYFRKREEWRVTDVLMNPMAIQIEIQIIMLVVAFILMVVTPKLAAQDPQIQQEMQNIQLPKVDMPDVADVLANMFGSSKKATKKTNVQQNNKRIAR